MSPHIVLYMKCQVENILVYFCITSPQACVVYGTPAQYDLTLIVTIEYLFIYMY